MKFCLKRKAREVSERSVGISYSRQQMTSLDLLCETKPTRQLKSKKREVQPRGSIYLQLGRKVYQKEIDQIIENF